jgi:EAL domain-containing protein (putative c-di-GMP-specific phosphodiesterase class I)
LPHTAPRGVSLGVATRLLLVDDDRILLRAMRRALARVGFEVTTATTGREAMELASDGAFDLAIVAYELGSFSGLRVLARIAERRPACVRIAMTGRRDIPIDEAINEGRVFRVLFKRDLTVERLVREVQDAVSAKHRQDAQLEAGKTSQLRREQKMLAVCFRDRLFRLALQPIHGVERGRVLPFAFEALLRVSHQTLHSPDLVLQAAERARRIDDLGSAVFVLAAESLTRLPPPERLFVNLHPEQLRSPERLARSLEVLSPWASRVVIELTERSRLQDLPQWEESMRVISAGGFAMAIDDLGAGYNSLSMLADLQPDFIKLDMDLTRNIQSSPRRQRLVSLLVAFGEATEARVIAEGVETEGEQAQLSDLGVRLMQGWVFGRPES